MVDEPALSRHAIRQIYLAIAEARPDETWWQAHYAGDDVRDDWVLMSGDTEEDVRDRWDELKENAESQTDAELEKLVPLNAPADTSTSKQPA